MYKTRIFSKRNLPDENGHFVSRISILNATGHWAIVAPITGIHWLKISAPCQIIVGGVVTTGDLILQGVHVLDKLVIKFTQL